MNDMKVEGHPNLVRRDGAIVNTDRDAFLQFLAQREAREKEATRMSALEQEVADLKGMIKQLLEKQNAA